MSRRKYKSKNRKKRSCKKRSYKKRSCKSVNRHKITHDFIKSYIINYTPKVDGGYKRPPPKKSLFKDKSKPDEARRPSIYLVKETDKEEVEDTYVPVEALKAENIKIVPDILEEYIPVKVTKVEPKPQISIPIKSYSDYSKEIEKREREEQEKNEKYKVRRKYDEGKYYFNLIYNEPEIVYSKIKEIYEDDDYIKNINDNTLYTPQEKEMLIFIYIYENELRNFNRDYDEAYKYFYSNYTKNQFKTTYDEAYNDFAQSKKIHRILDSIYLKEDYKPKVILIELYKKVNKKRALSIENIKNYKYFAKRVAVDINEKFTEATKYLKYKFQFTKFLEFDEYIKFLLKKYKNNNIIQDIQNNINKENEKMMEMLLIIYLKLLVDIDTGSQFQENIDMTFKEKLNNLIPFPIFTSNKDNKRERELLTNDQYKIALSYFDSVYGIDRDKNIGILFEKYKNFLTGKDYKENVIILTKLYQDSLKKDNLNYNSAINYFNSKYGKNSNNKIESLQERYKTQLENKDNYERIPILKEIDINETKVINRLYAEALRYFKTKGDPINYINNRKDSYRNIIDLYIYNGYADLEGEIKIYGFEKDEDIFNKVVAIIIYLTEDEEHKKLYKQNIDENYFNKIYRNQAKNRLDLLKLRYGDVNLPENKKIIYYGNLDNTENDLVDEKYDIATKFFKKVFKYNDEQIKSFVLRNLNNNEISRYIQLGQYPLEYTTYAGFVKNIYPVKKYNFDDDIFFKINTFILYEQEKKRLEDEEKRRLEEQQEKERKRLEAEEKKREEEEKKREEDKKKLRDEMVKFADNLAKEASNYFSSKYKVRDTIAARISELQTEYNKEISDIYNNGITIGWNYYTFKNLLAPENEDLRKKIKLYYLYTKDKEETIIDTDFRKALDYFYKAYPVVVPQNVIVAAGAPGPVPVVLPTPDQITSAELKRLFETSNTEPFKRIRQLAVSYDKYIKRYWDYTYPPSLLLKYKIYCYYKYDLLSKENLSFLEQFKVIYSSAAFIIEYILSWINFIFIPANYLYDFFKNIGVKILDINTLDAPVVVQPPPPTIEEILTRNTDISLEIRDELRRNNDQLVLLENNLTTLQNQGVNLNPNFNVLIQQYITRINEVQEELNRTSATSASKSAILTGQILKRLKDNADSLNRNTQQVANLIAASRAGSRVGSAFASPLHEVTYEENPTPYESFGKK